MDFDALFAHVLEALQREQRLSYRALQRRFHLSDDDLEDLKDELIKAKRLAMDENGAVLVWTGDSGTQPESVSALQPDRTVEQPAAQAIPPPPSQLHTPDAERRHITVMFSDLVDSTKLSGQLDPEEYRDILRAYQSTCSAVIDQFDDYIAQHLGDALLVYFGFPHAHEDDAQRAIHTGLGMLEAIKTLNTRLQHDKGIRLAIRVGIHTGLTVISDVGVGQRHEMLALGEAPNIASRMQGLAKSDTIAISAATFHLVEGYFTCEDVG